MARSHEYACAPSITANIPVAGRSVTIWSAARMKTRVAACDRSGLTSNTCTNAEASATTTAPTTSPTTPNTAVVVDAIELIVSVSFVARASAMKRTEASDNPRSASAR